MSTSQCIVIVGLYQELAVHFKGIHVSFRDICQSQTTSI